MNEELERKLLRQLKISNLFMGVVTFFILTTFLVMGFLVWTVVAFTNDVKNRVESIQTQTQETLDVRQQICNQSGISQFLSSEFCAPEGE